MQGCTARLEDQRGARQRLPKRRTRRTRLWLEEAIGSDRFRGGGDGDSAHVVPDHPILETDASRGGLNYSSATGDPIPNLGEQRLSLMTQEGTVRAMTFQAAPVDRPLGSVKRMCNSGHMVVFDEEGSYVYNKTSGELNWLREENGNYMLDTWVAPGFRRQR